MKDFKEKLVLLSLVISLVLSGCKGKDEDLVSSKEDYTSDNALEEVDTTKPSEDVSNKDEDEDLVVVHKKGGRYSIEDLYVINQPDLLGDVKSTFVIKTDYLGESEKLEEGLEEGIEYEFFKPIINSTPIFYRDKKHVISCGKELLLPDYTVPTITEASTYINFLEPEYKGEKLSRNQIESFEKKLNASNYQYDESHTYQIDKLLLVDSDGYYSLYSLERQLSFVNANGNPVLYFYDITNYKNALKIVPDVKVEDYDGSLDLSNILSCEITSLDASYALSLRDVEHEVIINYWEEINYNGMNGKMNKFYNYLTDEQHERGYLTQSEVEDLVNSLNNEKKYTMEPSNDTVS